jgi:protein-S-isoprenylcysteine O-methyltransferase Ste14
MIALDWLAALVLFLQLPIPLYWYVMHPQVSFWRRHQKAGFITGVLCSFSPVAACMIVYRRDLFRQDWPPAGNIAAGLALILLEGWIFWRVRRDLGGARLVGKTELSGGGDIVRRGIYARVRHPRYAGSFLAIVGACLLAGTRTAWIVAAVWALLMLVAIAFEEREMHARFGGAFEEYCRRVPRFFQLGAKASHGG